MASLSGAEGANEEDKEEQASQRKSSQKRKYKRPRRFKTFNPTSQTFTFEDKDSRMRATQEEAPFPDIPTDESQSEKSKFEFIGVSAATGASSSDARRKARAHVMRNYHKGRMKIVHPTLEESPEVQKLVIARTPQLTEDLNQGYDWMLSYNYTNLGDDITIYEGTADFSTTTLPSRSPVVLSSESETLDADKNEYMSYVSDTEIEILPQILFNPITYPTKRQEYRLIHHYIQVFAKLSVPMTSRSEAAWFRCAISDCACYNATLFVAAAHQALVSGPGCPIPPEAYHHKGEAIRMINERLNDTSKALEDSTIAAISSLAAFENINGLASSVMVHISGLRRITQLKGGLSHLGMNGFLGNLVQWVDLSNALVTYVKPQFHSPSVWDKLCHDEPHRATEETLTDIVLDLWNDAFQDSSPNLSPPRFYPGMNGAMSGIFHAVRQLSSLLSSNPTILSSDQQQRYGLSVLNIEMQTNCSAHSEGAIKLRKEYPQNLDITYWPWNISITIYSYLVFRSMPTYSSIFDLLVQRLKHHLFILEPDTLWTEFPQRFLLWVLMMGAWASEGREEHEWFLTRLAMLKSILGLETWEQWKEVLVDYAWVEHVCGRPFSVLWMKAFALYNTGFKLDD